MSGFRFLKGHPLAMRAYFEQVLVLTYALPERKLRPLLPPGLVLDTYENYGFLAIAMVQTRNMRPRFAPSLTGRDFFLTGYRMFTRYRTPSGKVLRGCEFCAATRTAISRCAGAIESRITDIEKLMWTIASAIVCWKSRSTRPVNKRICMCAHI